MEDHLFTIPNDLSVPDWLRANGPGGVPQLKAASVSDSRAPLVRRLFPLTDADHEAIASLKDGEAQRAAVKEYRDKQRLARLAEARANDPVLARMERQAKRDAARRIAGLGIKATGKIYNGKRKQAEKVKEPVQEAQQEAAPVQRTVSRVAQRSRKPRGHKLTGTRSKQKARRTVSK